MRELGSDYFNPRYRPERLGKPLAEIDRTYDYDFALVDRTFERLRGVDRDVVLAHVFREVTRGASDPTEQHLAVLAFLQQLAHHNPWTQPMHRDRTWVCDPLVLLELNEMRCGSVSTLAVDLFGAGGYEGRLAGVGAHTLAEIFYDGGWHYFDADIFGGGESVIDEGGAVPSLAELADTPEELDRLAHYRKFNPQMPVLLELDPVDGGRSFPYPSSYYFSTEGYGSGRPLHQTKRATPAQERASRFFGWEARYLQTVRNDELRLTGDPIRRQYGPPRWESHRLGRSATGEPLLSLSWQPAGAAPELAGYRLDVRDEPRGWDWGADGWKPGSYDSLFGSPAGGRPIETGEARADVELEPDRTHHISVTALDAYGARIGKAAFLTSPELIVETRARER